MLPSDFIPFIVDLDLYPFNDLAKDFYDVYWLDILDYENQRQLCEVYSQRKHHPILDVRNDVYKSDCGNLF